MRKPAHILVVDDDDSITRLLCEYLAGFGFEAHAAADGTQMQRHLDQHAVDLVVLDLMLPGTDGLSLARALRQRSRIGIIMLTALGSPADRVVGLEIGADDYLGKPFEPRELVARIHSVLRRSDTSPAPAPGAPDVVRFDGWQLARNARTLTSPGGMLVPLSNAEFQLLQAFLKAPRRVVRRDQLLEQARGRLADEPGRSIDLLVSRLRQKLTRDATQPALIKTVRGEGYMFTARSVQAAAAPCYS